MKTLQFYLRIHLPSRLAELLTGPSTHSRFLLIGRYPILPRLQMHRQASTGRGAARRCGVEARRPHAI